MRVGRFFVAGFKLVEMRLFRILLILGFIYATPLWAQAPTPTPVWKNALESSDVSKLQALVPPLSASVWGEVLRAAVLRRDTALVRAILTRPMSADEKKALLESVDPMGSRALYVAVSSLQNDLAKELMDAGANINVTATDPISENLGRLPRPSLLAKAFLTANEPMVRTLLERNVELNVPLESMEADATMALCRQALATRNQELLELILPKIPKTGNRFIALDSNRVAANLWRAAMVGGDLEMVKTLRLAGVPIEPVNRDTSNESTSSALLLASGKGRLDIVRWLLENGANINIVGSQSETALGNAITRGDEPMVDLLLASTPKPDLEGNNYSNPLWRAISDRAYVNLSIVRKLLNTGAHLQKNDALFEAAIRGDLKALEEQKENWGREDSAGRTAMHYAAWLNQTPVLKTLIAAGIPQKADKLGQTPLFYAARGDAFEAAEFIIQNGADVRKNDSVGLTPLHLAVALSPKVDSAKNSAKPLNGKPANTAGNLVNLLLKNGADAGAVTFGTAYGAKIWVRGTTPLHGAAFYGNVSALTALLDAKAPIESATESGLTPLEYAARGGQEKAISLLAERGAKISPKAITYAATLIPKAQLAEYGELAQGQRGAAIKKLVALGADVNAASPKDNPPLIELLQLRQSVIEFAGGGLLAVIENWGAWHEDAANRVAIATALLESGADPNIRSAGRSDEIYGLWTSYESAPKFLMPTALHIATTNNDLPLVQTLLKWKANPKLWDGVGRTPYDVAVRRGENSLSYTDPFFGHDRESSGSYGDRPMPILVASEANTQIRIALKKAGGAVVGPGPFLMAVNKNLTGFVTDTLKTQPELSAVTAEMRSMSHDRIAYVFYVKPGPSDLSVMDIAGISRPEISMLLRKTGGKPTNFMLSSALSAGNFALAEELFKAGAPIEPQRENIDPLLHQAARRGDVATLKWLLEHGVPVNQLNRAGQSARRIAKWDHQTAAELFLTEQGGEDIMKKP